MTPDERQLLSGLFDRIRTASTQQQRDREAESFISDAVRAQPHAPYLLSQTVIVQEEALRAANNRLQELEAKVQDLERGQGGTQAGDQGAGGFLGGLGRSIFGGGGQPEPQRGPVPARGGYGQQAGYGQQQPPEGYGQAPQGGPWGQSAQPQGGMGGGGFLKGALGMAAGVAGGALLGNAVSGLFRGSNPFGIASGMPGFGGGGMQGGGETIVNNYYEGGPGGSDQGFDNGGGGFDNAADFGPDDGGFGSDDNYNV